MPELDENLKEEVNSVITEKTYLARAISAFKKAGMPNDPHCKSLKKQHSELSKQHSLFNSSLRCPKCKKLWLFHNSSACEAKQ